MSRREADNAEIARLLDEVADFLELEDANPFRVRAYRNAARVVRELPKPAAALARVPGGLEDLPGIGRDLAGKIRTIAETGGLPLHDELAKRVPHGLIEIMGVPGIGPKKAIALSRSLGVASAGGLRRAAAAHRVRAVAGFGDKSEEEILRNIPAKPSGAPRRLLLSEARPYAEALVAGLREARGAIRVEAAGSYRRRRETVGDLDILAACSRPEDVIERLASDESVSRVLARGSTKLTVLLTGGLHVDLRVVPEESFGAALQYLTGSKAHSIELRGLAQARGLKLNEYGLFRGSRRVAGRDEKEVYAALGLPLIPPELREGRGEVARASEGLLPALLELGDIKGDLHMHTTATDGRDSLEDMVAAAKARGYEYIAITDHSKRVTMAHGLDERGLLSHWRRIDALAAETSGLAVLKGVEVDILEDGSLDMPDDVLRRADWVVASLHYGQRQSRERITERLLRAIENPYVSAIGHPTGRLIGRRSPYAVDLERVMKAAADRGCALEIDGQPDRMDLNDVNAAAAKALGVSLEIDSDAHSVRQLDNMENAVFQARRAGLTAADAVNARSLKELKTRREGASRPPTHR